MSGALPRAAVVLSGNELLDGRTRDTNGAFVSADLSGRGVKVTSACHGRRRRRTPHGGSRVLAGRRARPARRRRRSGHDPRRPHRRRVSRVPRREPREDPTALGMVEDRVRWVAERRHLDFDEMFPLARRQALLPAGSTPVPPAGVAPGIAARSRSDPHLRLPRACPTSSRHVALHGRARSTERGSSPTWSRAHRAHLRRR